MAVSDEVKKVRELGSQIGYGNMMHIASALWRKSLIDQGVPSEGATVPVLMMDVKGRNIKYVASQMELYDGWVKESGGE